MVKHCGECEQRHDPKRPHCPKCGSAMVHQQRDCFSGWGCGNQWHNGCGCWIPDSPRHSKTGSRSGYGERNHCRACDNYTPHHFWIYDVAVQGGGKWRTSDWFCVTCYGPLPEGRENVRKDMPWLNRPERLIASPRPSSM